jgi:hypothetical protein
MQFFTADILKRMGFHSAMAGQNFTCQSDYPNLGVNPVDIITESAIGRS